MSKEAIEALESARAHILDAYRIWQADDVSAVPPPKSGAGAVIAKIDAFLSTLPIAGEGKELVDVLRQGIKDQGYGYTMKGNRLTVSTDEVFAVDLDKLASFILSALISSPGNDGGQEVEAVAWSERENAFTDFWEQCPKLVDASDVGKARQAFFAGMDAASFFDSVAIKTTTGLVERLRKRADEDQACADNSKVIVDALSEQMRLFESRDGHNVYAVRIAVDHKSGMERDNRYAADLLEAASRLSQQDSELDRMRRELADMTISRDGYAKQAMAREAEGRRKAFIEAAEIAVVFAGKHEPSYGLVSREIHEAILAVVGALRAKAEETKP